MDAMEMIKALNLEPPNGKLLQSMRGSYIHSTLPAIPVQDPVVVVFHDGQPDPPALPSTREESGFTRTKQVDGPTDPLRKWVQVSSLWKEHAKLVSEVRGSSNMVMVEL